VRAAVEAVQRLYPEKSSTETITTAKVARELGINPVSATRRLRTAIARGWVINLEQRKHYPAILEPGEPLPEVDGLPPASELVRVFRI